MKRFVPIFLALLILAGCAAGGQGPASGPEPESPPSSVSEPESGPSSAPPEAAKSVVEAYTGEADYHEEFSKGQLAQAKRDLERFLAEHPDIGAWGWRPIRLFGGYQIDLKENSDDLTAFSEGYPIAGVYQTTDPPEEEPMRPDR